MTWHVLERFANAPMEDTTFIGRGAGEKARVEGMPCWAGAKAAAAPMRAATMMNFIAIKRGVCEQGGVPR